MSADPRTLIPIHLRRFSALPEDQRNNTVRPLSARLATGRWVEHREAAEFIEAHCTGHGDAIDTLVRAILHYRDHLVAEGVLVSPAAAEQRLFDVPEAPARQQARPASRRSASSGSGRRVRS